MTDKRDKAKPEVPAAESIWGIGLTPEELDELRQVESVVVSRVYVRPAGANVRIALGEVIEGQTHWHSAMTVAATDLIPIAELMLSQAKWTADWVANQYAIAAAQKEPGPDNGE